MAQAGLIWLWRAVAALVDTNDWGQYLPPRRVAGSNAGRIPANRPDLDSGAGVVVEDGSWSYPPPPRRVDGQNRGRFARLSDTEAAGQPVVDNHDWAPIGRRGQQQFVRGGHGAPTIQVTAAETDNLAVYPPPHTFGFKTRGGQFIPPFELFQPDAAIVDNTDWAPVPRTFNRPWVRGGSRMPPAADLDQPIVVDDGVDWVVYARARQGFPLNVRGRFDDAALLDEAPPAPPPAPTETVTPGWPVKHWHGPLGEYPQTRWPDWDARKGYRLRLRDGRVIQVRDHLEFLRAGAHFIGQEAEEAANRISVKKPSKQQARAVQMPTPETAELMNRLLLERGILEIDILINLLAVNRQMVLQDEADFLAVIGQML